MIQLNDFTRQWNIVRQSAVAAFERAGASGWYILGREVEQFEEALARFFATSHAVGVGNGMDAIEIALRATGIKTGDRVLTTPLSAFATTLSILRAGGQPVFADVDDRGLIDLKACRKALEKDRSIKFFLPVHLYGFSLDLEELAKLASEFGVTLIEDCAQAIGAKHRGVPVGTVGAAAALSFYPTKNLGAMGDAGALITNEKAIFEKARSLRHYGQTTTYVHDRLGMNSRLDEVHAAVLRDAMLPRLKEWTARRSAIAAAYRKGISNKALRLPNPDTASEPVWHLFPVFITGDREAFRTHLRAKSVASAIHYPELITKQKAITDSSKLEIIGALSVATELCATEVSLPIHPFLTDDEVQTVIEACNSWNK